MHLVDALLPRQRANTEPALTRSDLIAELIVVTIFDQIATALARGETVDEKALPFFKAGNKAARPTQSRWEEAPHLTTPSCSGCLAASCSGSRRPCNAGSHERQARLGERGDLAGHQR